MPRQAPAPPRIWYTIMDSPFGPVCIAGAKAGLLRVDFQRGNRPVRPAAAWQEDSELLRDAIHQLQEYFQGQRQSFSLPLAPPGTPFQQRVWQELQRIPFGTTLTYRELAQRLGMPHAARAVGHPQTLGEFPIGQRRTKRYALEFLPDALLKRCPWWGER